MKPEKNIDFTKINWEDISMEKLNFFYREALQVHDKTAGNINALNSKAHSMLSAALACLAAVTGFMIAVWGNAGTAPVFTALTAASCGFTVTVILFFAAIVPRDIYTSGEGAPYQYFSGDYYKQTMAVLLAGGIVSANRQILINQRIARVRGRFIIAGIAAFAGTLFVTLFLLLIARFVS